MPIAPILHGVNISTTDEEIDRADAGCVEQVFAGAGAAYGSVDCWRPVTAGDDHGLAAVRRPAALHECRQLGSGVHLVLMMEPPLFSVQRKLT